MERTGNLNGELLLNVEDWTRLDEGRGTIWKRRNNTYVFANVFDLDPRYICYTSTGLIQRARLPAILTGSAHDWLEKPTKSVFTMDASDVYPANTRLGATEPAACDICLCRDDPND